MKRGDIDAYAMHLTGKKMKDLANAIKNNLNSLENINMPSNICSRRYIEDVTNEIRHVNVIQLGLPVQVEVCFYL